MSVLLRVEQSLELADRRSVTSATSPALCVLVDFSPPIWVSLQCWGWQVYATVLRIFLLDWPWITILPTSASKWPGLQACATTLGFTFFLYSFLLKCVLFYLKYYQITNSLKRDNETYMDSSAWTPVHGRCTGRGTRWVDHGGWIAEVVDCALCVRHRVGTAPPTALIHKSYVEKLEATKLQIRI
jgi:hypothetical protein